MVLWYSSTSTNSSLCLPGTSQLVTVCQQTTTNVKKRPTKKRTTPIVSNICVRSWTNRTDNRTDGYYRRSTHIPRRKTANETKQKHPRQFQQFSSFCDRTHGWAFRHDASLANAKTCHHGELETHPLCLRTQLNMLPRATRNPPSTAGSDEVRTTTTRRKYHSTRTNVSSTINHRIYHWQTQSSARGAIHTIITIRTTQQATLGTFG